MGFVMNYGIGPVQRLMFKEIRDGDWRKFHAISNDDPDAGGGAQDLRFSGHQELMPVVQAMFPAKTTLPRTRGGQPNVPTDVWNGSLAWVDAQGKHCKAACFELPQDNRPNELRLTNVDQYDVFAKQTKVGLNGMCVLLLLQDQNNDVWPIFTTQGKLATDPIDPVLQARVLQALGKFRHPNHAAVGFIDLVNGTYYDNGR